MSNSPIVNVPPHSELLDARTGGDSGVRLTPGWTNLMAQLSRYVGYLTRSGITAERPATDLYPGRTYFDDSYTPNGRPIWVSSDRTNFTDLVAPIHGRLNLSAPQVGTPFDDPNKISLSPFMGGGLLVKSADTGLWTFVDFRADNSIEGDRTNCYLDGVPGQALATDGFYGVGVKIIAGVPVINFFTTGVTKTADTFVDVAVGDSFCSVVGHVYTLADSFLFTGARSVVSTWFPTCNQFGLYTPQALFTTGSAVYGSLGAALDISLVSNSTKCFTATALGYASHSAAGESCFMKLKVTDHLGTITFGTEGAMTSAVGGQVHQVVSHYGVPNGIGYYHIEVLGRRTTAGTGSFTVANTALILSA